MKKLIAVLSVLQMLSALLCACTLPETTVSEEMVELKCEEWLGELIAQNGVRYEYPSYGGAEYGDRVLFLCNNSREVWLCTTDEGFTKLSGEQLVIDYTVAYDTVYWFTLEREVWAVDWYSSTEAYLFCEDAIAVSLYSDES